MDKKYCPCCNQTLNLSEFYKSPRVDKYPDGYLDKCKKCATLHVDNWDASTYLPILEDVDVPYIPDQWNKIMVSYANDGKPMTGTTILGRYLAVMKIKQYKDFHWKDTEFLQQMADKKIEDAMKRQGFDAAQIAEAIQKGSVRPPDKATYLNGIMEDSEPGEAAGGFFREPSASYEELGLTEEDVTYLKIKWGKAYKPEEWVSMEQLYEDFMASYDVQGAGHEDTLKLICKTSLQCNKLIDIGDVDGYQKMSKVYDALMKSGKFTAVQNKTESGEFVDSVGELVMMCEKDGYIERYYVEDPKDRVDETLMDMKRYTKTLIDEETNLSAMLETAIKQNQKEDEAIKENEEDEVVMDDEVSIEDIENEIKDYEDFNEFLESEEDADLSLMEEFENGS